MTKAYTTIIKDELFEWYGIFFGDKLAYVVNDATEKFHHEDLAAHNMLPVSKAYELY